MNILDAVRIQRKTQVQGQGAAVMTMTATLPVLGTMLSIREMITNTKDVRARQIETQLSKKVLQSTMQILRRDRQVSVDIDDEESSFLTTALTGAKHAAIWAIRGIFKGVTFVLSSVMRYVVAPVFRLMGSAVLRLLPLIFSPAGLMFLGAGITGWGAYELYKRLKTKPDLGPAPEPAVGGLPPERDTTSVEAAPEVVIPEKLANRKGIRNNNPGNLRFVGQEGATADDTKFAVWRTQGQGLYHMARQIGLHYGRGKNTISKLIQVWAPAHENRTGDYIAFVARQTGIGSDQVFDFSDPQALKSIMRAIIIQENGGNPYSDAQLEAAALQAIGKVKGKGDSTDLVVPASGVISSEYGHRHAPTKGASTQHKGVDIANKAGTPIVAAHSGTVVNAGRSGGYGNLVDIKGDNFFTRYGHLKSIGVREGQVVGQGQKIGEMGSTGVSTAPHLHFEVREVRADGRMGAAQDPLDHIKGRRGSQVAAVPVGSEGNGNEFVRGPSGRLMQVKNT